MKSINKLILFFMLIFISISLTANAGIRSYVQMHYTKSNTGIQMVTAFANSSGHPTESSDIGNTKYLLYNVWTGQTNTNYFLKITYWNSIEGKAENVYVAITRNDYDNCVIPYKSKSDNTGFFLSMGRTYYFAFFKEVTEPNLLPAANKNVTLRRLGEKHSMCGYTGYNNSPTNLWRIDLKLYPSLNQLTINIIHEPIRGSGTVTYANYMRKLSVPITSPQPLYVFK